MAILVLDDELDCFGILRKKFASDKNGLAFYSGQIQPHLANGLSAAKSNYIKFKGLGGDLP